MFLDKMPDVSSAKQVTVFRAKTNQPVRGLLTGSLIRTWSHWYQGHTMPCLKESLNRCPLCDLGINQRYYAYYSVRGKSGMAAMIELTATAEAELVDYERHRPSGSGMLITASRAAGKRNNPVHVEVEFRDLTAEERATLLRVDLDKDIMMRTLIRLWNLPNYPLGMNETDYDLLVEKHIKEVINGNV